MSFFIFILRPKILWKGSVVKTNREQEKRPFTNGGTVKMKYLLCRGSEAENAKSRNMPWAHKAYLVFTLLQIGQTQSLTDAMLQINNSRKFCWILTLKVK